MHIIHKLEELSVEHQAKAQECIKSIRGAGMGSWAYNQLESTHPVRYAAPVIQALVDEGYIGCVENHVPSEAFADPTLAAQICTRFPRVTERLDDSLVTQPAFMAQVIQTRPACIKYVDKRHINDALIEALLSQSAFDPKVVWNVDLTHAARTALQCASEAFWTQEKALALCSNVHDVIQDLSQFKNDVPVQLEILKRNPEYYQHCTWDVRTAPAVLQQVLSMRGVQLEHAPWHIQDDPQWAHLAIEQSPYAYKYVDHHIAVQPEVALGALERAQAFADVLDAVPQRLCADIRFCHQVLDIVEKKSITASVSRYIDPTVLLNDGFTQRLCALQPQHLDEIHKDHPKGIWHLQEHAAKMCASRIGLLINAPMSNDPDFCRKVLDHALVDARNTHNVLEHMKARGIGLEQAHFETILQQHPSAYSRFPDAIKREPQTVLALLRTPTENTDTLRDAFNNLPANTFENNEPLLHTFLDAFMNSTNPGTSSGSFRRYEIAVLTETYLVPDVWMNAIKTDPQIAERFMEKHPRLYSFLSDELKEKPAFFERFLNVMDEELNSADFPEALRNDAHYALKAVQRNPSNFSMLDSELRKDPALVWEFATHSDRLGWVPNAFANDTEWVLKLCQQRQDDEMVRHAAPSIKGLVTKMQTQLRQSNPDATMKDAALHLAAKRTAQSEQKALKTAFKDAPRAAARPVANRPMGRSL